MGFILAMGRLSNTREEVLWIADVKGRGKQETI